ncbi:NADH:flavin oxidoreductase [Sporanaerobium hydrogeniformans]|uniref:NADH:flavin oxidoreductase n=1 Tax=Sporanaerobium hydrogeniformans TaxID=3072179 RepID=A0AC61DF16_9FIRM|nr:FAD-dependent oxidoreductase [Sporanaerobium hydrogeniformans]PHV71147.1 NADH:flavin oxidoreductase [Sporanaerobium hydrogeniformans]
MPFEKLMTPYKIGKMEVKNRIAMAPMGLNAGHKDGTIDTDEIDYFEERAKGGTGMIIMGCQFLTHELAQGSLEGYLDTTYPIPQLTTLCEAVQRYGTKIVAQLSCGTGKNAFANMYGEPPVSASPIPSMFNPDLICRALSVDDIQTIMKQFAYSSKILKDAGFDAIEVHAHAGYLVDQFMSAVWNKREDEYGGSPENRMRFAVEIVQSIRSAIGPDMPIIFRMAMKHHFEGGRTLEETLPLLKYLEDAGVDAFDIDTGSYENIDYIFPPAYLGDACMSEVCEPTRKVTNKPILNAGNHTPETALALIEAGHADFVLMGRPLIAEPYMAKKLLKGKRDEVRPCIRCNEDCIGRIINRLTKISCSVNPVTGFEKRFQLVKTTEPKKVVVVGGGPGGMEAARTAALIGHDVTLVEAAEGLGGQLRSAATPPFKSQLRELVTWYSRQMEILNVNVKLNTTINADSQILAEADEIFVATGAVPVKVNIKGIENTVDILQAHLDESKLVGDHIIYCGGGLSSCDSALETAMKGKKVTVVEMLDEVAVGDHFINKASLIPMMLKQGVTICTGHKVLEITSNGVKAVKKDGTEVFIEGTTVVASFGMVPNSTVARAIDEKYHNKTHIIGDCVKVGKVGGAVRAGMYAAMSID